MAETAVARRGVSIALACRTFGVSETCYGNPPVKNGGITLEALRDLIERVDFGPGAESDEPEIILTGALASMVRLGLPSAPTKTTPSTASADGVPDLFLSSVKVVAGARFELTTFRL
jgi:hypothetical protein